MRPELKKIAEKFQNKENVYLRGPFGSGKTFLVRKFVESFLQTAKSSSAQKEFFVLFRDEVSESDEVLYTLQGEARGWQNCEEALHGLILAKNIKLTLNLTRSYQNASGWRTTLQPLLQGMDYQFIIVLDEYGRCRERVTKEDFGNLCVLKDKAWFILTDANVRRSYIQKAEQSEQDFLEGFRDVGISLPTLEEATAIAQGCWKKKLGESGWELKSEHALRLSQAAGRYPLLVDTLTSYFVDVIILTKTPYDLDDTSNFRKRIDANLEAAAKGSKFFQSLRPLWESLKENEKEQMQLLAMAQIDESSQEELFEIWLNRTKGNRDQRRREAEAVLKNLRDERLHVITRNQHYEIASHAFADFICDQSETKKLASQLNFKLAKKFSAQTFLKLLLGVSLPVFVIFILLLQFNGWLEYKQLGFLIWLIPFIYYFHLRTSQKNFRP